MKNILACYAKRNPHIGYCQGLNFVAAKILSVIDHEEDSFWILTTLIEDILPIDYFSSMVGVMTDQKIFNEIIAFKFPKFYKRLTQMGGDTSLFTL
mmetsp:Transcript_27667/g.24336  ORF Transcript_27667/g.24336 Transcript_27667/m.24336 type:complete len:96 (-) Transcript_27667:17-304(-)